MGNTITRMADYRPYPYEIVSIYLDVSLDPDETMVRAKLEVRAKDAAQDLPDLVLDGNGLDLKLVKLDGETLGKEQYSANPDQLVIHGPRPQFTLETEVAIHPSRNPSKKGLFWHANVLVTHCEPEGFRRITYFPDRPDVLAVYTVRLEAEREAFPTLLSNGDCTGNGWNGRRHWALWEDPYPKPSYIFAMMAGKFETLQDHYITSSGQRVDIEIYAEQGEAERCSFALESLKSAFEWDEKVFGLEYDLPVYNVVALPAYAGAQENKGLNLFGADGIIADPAISTDEDFTLIKRIIGHEYFHNWTGNRVTCRDWFQLSLKEGLTRLRDQLFMEDELEKGTFRIEQVKALRRNQFPEDDGPAAHPVQPAEFVEIENFYTNTIYDKGAEVLRMLRTIVGKDAFVSAVKAYLDRFDGQAVTVDDLIDVVAEVTKRDLTQFRKWLSQAGRPTVLVDQQYSEDQKELKISFTQRVPDKPGPGGPMHIPIQLALLDESGNQIGAPRIVELTDWSQSLQIDGIDRRCIPSLLRDFSAPITLEFDLSYEDLAHLALRDDDPFVAWNSVQQLFTRIVREIGQLPPDERLQSIPPVVISLVGKLLENRAGTSPGLVAQMLSLPDEPALSEGLEHIYLDEHIAARHSVKRAIGIEMSDQLRALYTDLGSIDPTDRTQDAISRRSLRSALLDLLLATEREDAFELCLAQITDSPSITEEFEALCLISHFDHPRRKAMFDEFYRKYADQPLVIDKWFKAYALARAPGVIDEIIALEKHPAFDIQNTSRTLAYYGSLFRQNRVTFHDLSGKGYRFLADRLVMMDQMGRGRPGYFMPQLDQWRRFDERRKAMMHDELVRVAATPGISATLNEVVSRTLA